MSVEQVANDLADLCRKGQFDAAVEKHYGPDIVSVEPVSMPGMPAEMKGIDQIRGKNQWWVENHEVHEVKVDGPFVGGNQFAVRYYLDVTAKPTGKRMQMTEMALYTVKDDKIVREEFYYNAPGQ